MQMVVIFDVADIQFIENPEMKQKLVLVLIISLSTFLHAATQEIGTSYTLPDQYFRIMEMGIQRIEKRLTEAPDSSLASIESHPGWRHFPSCILIPAVLYSKEHKANKLYHSPKMLELAKRIGDLLAREDKKDHFTPRGDSDWDTYMWLEAYRILEHELGDERRSQWSEALLRNLELLVPQLSDRIDFPWYNAPYITTSPNHYAIYASTLLVAAKVFNKPEWYEMAARVLHRFATEEQAPDGYWGEHSQAGPTTGYDYLTETQMALYWEYSGDQEALKALRKSTDFHKYFTYPDGTPVETINDRNRHWGVSMWGHFGFSNFPDGRQYAAFLTGFFNGDNDIEAISRIAQNALYYKEGELEPIPQEMDNYVHKMNVPAGIRKTGPWVVAFSGIIAPEDPLNNFFLDRQGNMSLFHQDRGLIISGANSKRQPELATFSELVERQMIHMPVSSRLLMEDKSDRLALAYLTFFAVIEVPRPDPGKLEFSIRTTYKWGDAVSRLNLQLVLKEGRELITGSGSKILLGNNKIVLDGDDLLGSISHNGWTMQIPKEAELIWPVYPFNPYSNGPEKDLSQAVGLLSFPLKPENQEFSFILVVNPPEH